MENCTLQSLPAVRISLHASPATLTVPCLFLQAKHVLVRLALNGALLHPLDKSDWLQGKRPVYERITSECVAYVFERRVPPMGARKGRGAVLYLGSLILQRFKEKLYVTASPRAQCHWHKALRNAVAPKDCKADSLKQTALA